MRIETKHSLEIGSGWWDVKDMLSLAQNINKYFHILQSNSLLLSLSWQTFVRDTPPKKPIKTLDEKCGSVFWQPLFFLWMKDDWQGAGSNIIKTLNMGTINANKP